MQKMTILSQNEITTIAGGYDPSVDFSLGGYDFSNTAMVGIALSTGVLTGVIGHNNTLINNAVIGASVGFCAGALMPGLGLGSLLAIMGGNMAQGMVIGGSFGALAIGATAATISGVIKLVKKL